MKDYINVRIERKVADAIKDVADGMPITRYLGQLVDTLSGHPSLSERVETVERKLEPKDERIQLSAEIKELGKQLNFSHNRLEIDAAMCTRANIEALRWRRGHLLDRLAHPERGEDFYRREYLARMAAHADAPPEEVEALAAKLASLTPESFKEVLNAAQEYKND